MFPKRALILAATLISSHASAQQFYPYVRDEGVSKGQFKAIDFQGAGVSTYYDGGSSTAVVVISGSAGTPTGNFLYATLSAAQSTNKSQGDHLKFDVVKNSGGSNITLDTATSYSKVLGAASVGRFTLAAGHSYHLQAFIPDITVPVGAIVFNWRRASDGLVYNPGGLTNDAPASVAYSSPVQAIVTATTSTVVEVTLTYTGSFNQLGESATGPDGGANSINTYPSATIFQLD